MDINFEQLEAEVEVALVGSGENPLGSKFATMEGVPVGDVPKGSECIMLHWLEDNTPYTYEMFITMTKDEGTQGVMIYNEDDELEYVIVVPVTGGKSGNVSDQMHLDNREIIQLILEHVKNNN